MKIAIIGSGISGLTASYLLNKRHEITLFEKNDYIGGHTHTHDITIGEQTFSIDSGFIVYNEKSYPNLIALFNLTTGYFLSQRAFSSLAQGELLDPENIARQKRLLHKVVRAMLIN